MSTEWFKSNGGPLIAIIINLVLLGVTYGTLATTVASNANKIKELEQMKADQTRWIVDEHQKRLDQHDMLFASVNSNLNSMLLRLERIDAKGAKP